MTNALHDKLASAPMTAHWSLVARARATPRHASASVIGIAGTLVLHGLMFQAMTLGTSAARHRAPDETGPGASAIVSSAQLSMTLVWVQLPGVDHSAQLELLASRGFTPAQGPIQVVSADPAPAFEEDTPADPGEDVEAPQLIGDPAQRALLFGRYTGQINARIERAWRRPRSPVSEPAIAGGPQGSEPAAVLPQPAHGEAMRDIQPANAAQAPAETALDLFRCTVRITQDAHGAVLEVELLACNGTLAWQQSLVQAIQHASPLPAPPVPAVFTNALMLTFESHAFQPGMQEDAYELAGAQLARYEPPRSQHFTAPAGSPAYQDVVAPRDTSEVIAPALPFDAPLSPNAELTP